MAEVEACATREEGKRDELGQAPSALFQRGTNIADVVFLQGRRTVRVLRFALEENSSRSFEGIWTCTSFVSKAAAPGSSLAAVSSILSKQPRQGVGRVWRRACLPISVKTQLVDVSCLLLVRRGAGERARKREEKRARVQRHSRDFDGPRMLLWLLLTEEVPRTFPAKKECMDMFIA